RRHTSWPRDWSSDVCSSDLSSPNRRIGLIGFFWHPIAGVSEFEKKPIKPIRLFGEDLVVFKALNGKFGLVSSRCAHRGSNLAFRSEERRAGKEWRFRW